MTGRAMALTPDELLAGSSLHHQVEIPPDLLDGASARGEVALQPLTVRDLQLIAKAAKEDDCLSAALMIQRAMVEPEMSLEQVQRLPAGLARFLVDRINWVSGIEVPQNALQEMVQAPLAKACFVLAKEFGWTPEEVSGMTIGQILLFLEMNQQQGGQAKSGSA
jgi:hypothetical protein